jgi:restriction system protein
VISKRGADVLRNPPARVDIKFLEQFPGFSEFRERRKDVSAADESATKAELETPEEQLEEAYSKLREDLVRDLLIRVKGASPEFFEGLVVELLLKMGYGGSRREAGQAIGRSGDEGD